MGGNFPSLNLSSCALSSFSYQITLNEERGMCETVMKQRSTAPTEKDKRVGTHFVVGLFLLLSIGFFFFFYWNTQTDGNDVKNWSSSLSQGDSLLVFLISDNSPPPSTQLFKPQNRVIVVATYLYVFNPVKSSLDPTDFTSKYISNLVIFTFLHSNISLRLYFLNTS